MSEDTARAVGAGGSTVEIAGKKCKARPLTVKELLEIQRHCLNEYRVNKLEYYAKTAALYPDDRGWNKLEMAQEEMADWDVADIPPKETYNAESVNITEKLTQWLENEADLDLDSVDKKKRDRVIRSMAVTAVEEGLISEDDLEELTGKKLTKMKLGYANWWITGSIDGMIHMVWKCFEPAGVTEEEVARELQTNKGMMTAIANEIEILSSAATKNG